ncbi:MAG: TIR domain-containing protein [Anaerolineae bacterium]|nr:TIR domain-containing protein [Anaerolineae bacterium]
MNPIDKIYELKQQLEDLLKLLKLQSVDLKNQHSLVTPRNEDMEQTITNMQQQLDELEAVTSEINLALRRLQLQEILAAIADPTPAKLLKAFTEFIGAERGMLWLGDLNSQYDTYAQGTFALPEQNLATEIAQKAIETQDTILTDNAQHNAKFREQQSIIAQALRWLTVTPILVNHQLVGAIYNDKPIRQGILPKDDLNALAETLGDFLTSTFDHPLSDQEAFFAGGVAEEVIAPELIDDLLEDQLKENKADERDSESLRSRGAPQAAPAIPAPTMPGASVPAPPQPAKKSAPNRDESTDVTTRFSAYYPPEIKLDVWETMYAYIFRPKAASLVEADANRALEHKITAYRRVDDETMTQVVEEGTLITATPYLPGVQFNPPQLMVGFYDDWQRFEFKLRAKEASLEQAANGYITFTTAGIIIAEIPISIFVTAHIRQTQPIIAAQKIYNAIFCSYSHADTAIVERVELACKTLGLDYLRDVHTLKSGQDWNDQLYRLIEQADIFQLFWSEKASKSIYVEQEWRHALALADRSHFIRPVYWSQPMPRVPEELGHIHFTYQPDLAIG